MLKVQKNLLLVLLVTASLPAFGQRNPQYNNFEIKGDELYWSYTYDYPIGIDSLRGEVVRMLKSKYYTFNVFKIPEGYNGELKHYRVNCRRYHRKFINTPRIFWSGEWSGKFVIEVVDSSYRVSVYGLYGEQIEKSPANYRLERTVKGRYYDMVTRADGKSFKRNELNNMQLMSLSLKDEFDIANTVSPIGE